MSIWNEEDNLRNSLKQYFQDWAFPVSDALKDSNEPTGLVKKLDKFLQEKDVAPEHLGAGFVGDLYLERQVPYRSNDKALSEMDGMEPEVKDAFAKYLVGNAQGDASKVHLYLHQAQSFDAVRGGKNLVVCTLDSRAHITR